MSDQILVLPFLKPWWHKAKEVIRRMFEANTVDRLRRRLHILTQCGIPHLKRDPFSNLCSFLEEFVPLRERIHFLEKVFPTILYLVLNLENHPEEWSSLIISSRNKGCELILRRSTVASLLACSFLCLLPKQHSSYMINPNFDILFDRLNKSVARVKLKCFINYFDVLSQQVPANEFLGAIKLTRKALPRYARHAAGGLALNDTPLVNVTVDKNGSIESCPSEALKVAFASSSVGLGIWEDSCTQQDVLLCQSPEILGCCFLCEALMDHEALEFAGCSVFSVTKGLSSSFTYLSSATELESGSPASLINYSSLCSLDSLNFQGLHLTSQYMPECVIREINKCFIGFLPHSKLPQTRMNYRSIDVYSASIAAKIYHDAKLQLRSQFLKSRLEARRTVAESFADNMVLSLVSDLPVSLRHKKIFGSHFDADTLNQCSESNASTSNFIETLGPISLKLTPPDNYHRSPEIVVSSSPSPVEVDKSIEEFSELFASNLLRLVMDQLFPKSTVRRYVYNRRRSSSRSNSLTQSFSLYDIVHGSPGSQTGEPAPAGGDALAQGVTSTGAGLLRPFGKDDQHSNFFLGDIEEVSADLVTEYSDYSSRGSDKYKTHLPLSKSVAADKFFKGRKFPSIREQYANVLSTQILAEAIAGYIKLLAKKHSSTSGTSSGTSPRMGSVMSEGRKPQNLLTLDDLASHYADRVIVSALNSVSSNRHRNSNVSFFVFNENMKSSMDVEDDLLSLQSQETLSKSGMGSTTKSSRRRSSSNTNVSTASQKLRRLYSIFLLAIVMKMWSVFVVLLTRPFTDEQRRASFTPSESGERDIEIFQKKMTEKRKRSLASSVYTLEYQNFTSARPNVSLPQERKVSNSTIELELFEPKSCFDKKRDNLTIATGNFSCGQYGGDPQFRFCIEWVSASLAGIEHVLYHPCGDSRVQNLDQFINLLHTNNITTVSELFDILVKYSNYIALFKSYDQNEEPKSFFTFVYNLFK